MNIVLNSSSEADTRDIARELGALLLPGDVVALSGELGAGKTVFCKGIGEALGIRPEKIVSPTFTILTEHQGCINLHHVDAYRLSGEREAEETGIEESLYSEGVCVVEWAEKIANLLPNYSIRIKFTFVADSGRTLLLETEDTPRMRAFASRCKRYTTGG